MPLGLKSAAYALLCCKTFVFNFGTLLASCADVPKTTLRLNLGLPARKSFTCMHVENVYRAHYTPGFSTALWGELQCQSG